MLQPEDAPGISFQRSWGRHRSRAAEGGDCQRSGEMVRFAAPRI